MGRPIERGYYWHDDVVVLVDIGVPTDPLDRTTDEHGNDLQVLCWGELRAGKVLVQPVVDDGRWGERAERPKDRRTGADRAPDRYSKLGESGGADGLFVVGRGPEHRAMVWSSLSKREREQLARVSPGDVVDVLLDDGRIVRTTARSALIDQGARRLRQRTFHLTGIRGRYAAERVRVPGGWARKKGFTHYDHVGVPGQRVPYTCPAIHEVLGLLAGAGLDAGVMQRIVGRLELIRAYNAQLRRNQGRW